MKRSYIRAFTLIEMLTVMAIIAVIASLVVAVSGLVNQKAAKSRAEGEITAIAAANESYKADNGTYPQNDDTDKLDPRDPKVKDDDYRKASLYLYSELSGDGVPDGGGEPDGKVDNDAKVYFPFRPDQLGKDASKKYIKYIQDPFGQSYGYSTAAAEDEAKYRETLRKTPNTPRPSGSEVRGYNSASFDMWSRGGMTVKSKTTEVDQARWVKNW